MRLEGIYAPIRAELRRVHRELRKQLHSDSAFVRQLNRYIMNMPGKGLRPALVLFSAKTGRPDLDKAVHAAATVEMIHTATLIHDDVVDSSNLRRGRATVNVRWNDGVSIILGDHWYSRAFRGLSSSGIPGGAEALLEAIDRMCIGELEQLRRSYDALFTEREYLEIVRKKTGALMSFSCRVGALIGGVSPGEAQALTDYGSDLGMAFQIVDDCLDVVGTEERAGKSLGTDLAQGKLTLPVLYAMKAANGRDRRWLRRTLARRHVGPGDADRIRGIARQCRGVDYALEKAAEYRNRAKERLRPLRAGACRHSLSRLADHVVGRA